MSAVTRIAITLYAFIVILGAYLALSSPARAATSAFSDWEVQSPSVGEPAARHESGLVEVGGKLYLLGGRGMRDVQVYDPETTTWSDLGPTPLELHHFQPVAVGNSIYVIGSFTCCYPNEPTIADIHVFNTITNTWTIEGSMPASRARGSVASIVRDGTIYLVGGNTLGHAGGAVAWFDSYNPTTGVWETLPDAPNARDHFAAVLVDDYLVAAAGRQTDLPNPFRNAVAQTDMYDFATGTWSTADDIPTLRAGALAAAAGDEIIVAGGEINTTNSALANVEAMNVNTRQWRTLQELNFGRHSGGGVAFNGEFHVVAGSLNTGGAPETTTHEVLLIDDVATPDFDADGLTNVNERGVHGTDPMVADTDGDGLGDGAEVLGGSDPLVADADEVTDSEEEIEEEIEEEPSVPGFTGVDNGEEGDTETEPETDNSGSQEETTDTQNITDSENSGGTLNLSGSNVGSTDTDASTDTGNTLTENDDTLSANVSLLLLLALGVTSLTRYRLKHVNVSSENVNS